MGKHSGGSPAGRKPVARVDHPPIREAKSKRHDTYRAERKSSAAAVCTQCGVTSHGGRWTWGGPPLSDVSACLCPACQRIRDDYPAGHIELHGLAPQEREEVSSLIHRVEAAEQAEHPLERIMAIRNEDGMLLVTTTGTHLGRAIAGALGRRFHGRVSIVYPAGEDRVRVILRR